MTCGVYLITFGERSYVGSSQNVEQRWVHHRSDLRQGRHANCFMQRLWDKGQRPDFVLLLECTQDDLLVCEQHYIDTLRPELNLAEVAGAPMRGRRHSTLARERMSASQRSRTDGNRGWKVGRSLSEQHKHRVGVAQRARKEVVCVELDKRFYSVGEAARYLCSIGAAPNVKCRANIASACRGQLNKAYGYTWQYA